MRRSAGLFFVSSVALCFGAAERVNAQEGSSSQRWEVRVDSGRVTVGDPVTVHFRVRLDERDLLFDTIPKPADSLPDGVRLISVERLRRLPNREFVGGATLTFYRVGPQPLPVFALPFMRAVKGISHGMVESDTASIEVMPVLTAGNPSLRDIREIEPSPWPRLLPAAGALALVLGLLGLRRRRKDARVEPLAELPEPAAPPPASDPYDVALVRLEEIERQHWVTTEEVARHYESITDALRDYLEAAVSVPARERTTTELFWSLPPWLLEGGLRQRYESVFEEADLVKFARRRPDARSAAGFLDDARLLLRRWHESEDRTEVADAVR
jgi:hypothetical protein